MRGQIVEDDMERAFRIAARQLLKQLEDCEKERDAFAAELQTVKTERDLAVLTLAAFTPADKPLPTLEPHPHGPETYSPCPACQALKTHGDDT